MAEEETGSKDSCTEPLSRWDAPTGSPPHHSAAVGCGGLEGEAAGDSLGLQAGSPAESMARLAPRMRPAPPRAMPPPPARQPALHVPWFRHCPQMIWGPEIEACGSTTQDPMNPAHSAGRATLPHGLGGRPGAPTGKAHLGGGARGPRSGEWLTPTACNLLGDRAGHLTFLGLRSLQLGSRIRAGSKVAFLHMV